MSGLAPVQKFQLGDLVLRNMRGNPFVLGVVYLGCDENVWYGPRMGSPVFLGHELTLAPERPPYVPSERHIMRRDDKNMRPDAARNELYRCETDSELAARHAAERAAYDAQGDGT